MLSNRIGISVLLLGSFTLAASVPSATAATFTVTNTNDVGAGSLRQAITDANADSIVDLIDFAIPEGLCAADGVCTIVLASSLPDITDGVVIDGTTQPRFGTAPANVCATAASPSYMRILITSAAGHIFSTTATAETTIRGLAIAGDGPETKGIRIATDAGTNVQCNHFGTDGPGATLLGMPYGVTLAWDTVSGGNATVGTDGDGIDDLAERNVFGGGYGLYVNSGNVLYPNRISGNFFGLGADGTTPIDLGIGVFARQGATENLIGSDLNGISDDCERNIFSNLSVGVRISGWLNSGDGNQVVGNWFGIDAFGRSAPISVSAIELGSDGQNQEIRYNQIIGNDIGIKVNQTATIAATSGQNCIVGNTTGLAHFGSAINLDAEDNYWGASDGPSGIGSGGGDGILESGTGTVDFTPWLTSAAGICFIIMNDGFESGNLDGWSNSFP